MPHSVLEAIRMGVWDFEPSHKPSTRVRPTGALPGSDEKLRILAERLREGMPLWHPEDRINYDDYPE